MLVVISTNATTNGGLKMNENVSINKNTYYKLPIWFIAVALSNNKKNSTYKCSKKDLKTGNYFVVSFENISLKIPFKAMFHTNSKIKGIYGFDFTNATFCSSYHLKYCKIENKKHCYAYNFECIYKNAKNDYYFKMNAYFKGFLIEYFLNVVYQNNCIKMQFLEYINTNIKILRFNVNSDFRNLKDYLFLLEIVAYCENTTIYGYTARNDLLKNYDCNQFTNLTINGSNEILDNMYNAVFSLAIYLISENKCIGECLKCGKCWKYQNKVITTLFHHSNSDSILNTLENRLFLVELVNALDSTFNLKETDLKINKGIFTSLNKFFIKNGGFDLKDSDITNIKAFLDYLYYNKAELKENINNGEIKNYNIEILRKYGLY